jgi:hypothetical protein
VKGSFVRKALPFVGLFIIAMGSASTANAAANQWAPASENGSGFSDCMGTCMMKDAGPSSSKSTQTEAEEPSRPWPWVGVGTVGALAGVGGALIGTLVGTVGFIAFALASGMSFASGGGGHIGPGGAGLLIPFAAAIGAFAVALLSEVSALWIFSNGHTTSSRVWAVSTDVFFRILLPSASVGTCALSLYLNAESNPNGNWVAWSGCGLGILSVFAPPWLGTFAGYLADDEPAEADPMNMIPQSASLIQGSGGMAF